MLISLLLIFCLQLVARSLGNPDFFNKTENWKWEKSCSEHPFAVNTSHKTDMNNYDIGKQCALEFDYFGDPKDEREMKDFCEIMYPDILLTAGWEDNKIICIYQRSRVCKGPWSHVIGTKCISIGTKAVKYEQAKDICKKIGAKLLSPSDTRIIHFFTKLYQWPKPSPAIWAEYPGSNKTYNVFLQYKAIGSTRPGEKVLENNRNKEATVMCVGESKHLPGTKHKVDFCAMLQKFFKISTYVKDGDICYHTTQSLMIPRKENDGLVSIDHFTNACKVRFNGMNSVVAPTWEEPREIFKKAAKNKTALLLPGVLTVPWNKMDWSNRHTFSPMELRSAQFAHRIPRQVLKNDLEVEEMESLPVHADKDLWRDKFPFYSAKVGITHGMEYAVLMFTKEAGGKMENAVSYRRAPILCATSLSFASKYACPDGWEFAYRKTGNLAFCIKAFEGCQDQGIAEPMCREDYIDGFLAPMESAEEEMAILRSIKANYTMDLKKMKGTRLGGIVQTYNPLADQKEFIWNVVGNYPIVKVGSLYKRWNHGEPNFAPVGNQIENCVSIRYHNGISMGWNDVICSNLCKDTNGITVDGYACAINAPLNTNL